MRFSLGFYAGRLGWDECICRAFEVHETELGNHVAILGQKRGYSRVSTLLAVEGLYNTNVRL